jgi:nucleotidyltransferase substrate binding protein (TIGR01987 family)
MLDFLSFEKALGHLKKHYSLAVNEQNAELRFAFKTATIQSFEYNYEIALKMLKRVLRNNLSSDEELELMAFKDLIRVAAQHGLLDNPQIWFGYRNKRNITAHTYDDNKSEEIFKIMPDFIKDVEILLKKLKEKDVS